MPEVTVSDFAGAKPSAARDTPVDAEFAANTFPAKTSPTDAAPPTGVDLARASLAAARAAAKAKGRSPRQQTGKRSSRAGRRRTWSGPRPDDRDPQPLGRLASRLATERGWSDGLAGGTVFSRWARVVGADVAEHSKPIALHDGELTVQADSTAWATQLRLLQPQLLTRIGSAAGPGVVRRLKVQGPAAPSWRYGPKHVPGRGPRDTYG
ncbi:DciA family protein [Actinoalloteichus hymeniacidonis]|uniref:DciA family protein n=1 Tax=Actinoalloteichus hymeniacidonis TaxID=340345 RepID=UPI00184719FF|nr:putative nucleic acid-binding Zn ribbon protein [Actinoalloteichus hymeniacidonis]